MSFESALRSGSNVPLPRIVVQDDWDLAQLVEAKENVEQRAAVLDRAIGDIVGQLERAAWREANSQGLIDPSWFVRASDALRHRRRELKHMQKSLDEILSDRKQRAPVIAEFLSAINNYAKMATEGMPNPGLLQLSRVHPDVKGMAPQRFAIDDVERMTKASCVDAGRGHNVYIEARTVHGDLNRGERGKLEDTVAVYALVADSDNDKGESGYVPIQPTLVTESSYGTGNANLWFVFYRAIPAKEAKELGTLMPITPGGWNSRPP